MLEKEIKYLFKILINNFKLNHIYIYIYVINNVS